MDGEARDEVKRLAWADVEAVAEDAFSVGIAGRGVEWAKQAWDVLTRAELASYRTGLERCRVAVRFLALADVYLEFCETIFGQRAERYDRTWAADLAVSPSASDSSSNPRPGLKETWRRSNASSAGS